MANRLRTWTKDVTFKMEITLGKRLKSLQFMYLI